MNRNSKVAVFKLVATIVAAIGLFLVFRLWPDGPFAGLAVGCFGFAAGPIFILVAIDTGRTLRREQLGRAATIAAWLPQYFLGLIACIAAAGGFWLASSDTSTTSLTRTWECVVSLGVLAYGASLFTKAGAKGEHHDS
jgi:hypothetical protein